MIFKFEKVFKIGRFYFLIARVRGKYSLYFSLPDENESGSDHFDDLRRVEVIEKSKVGSVLYFAKFSKDFSINYDELVENIKFIRGSMGIEIHVEF